MQALLRPDFRPDHWSEADLDAAADHWLWLFEGATTTTTRSADHRTEVRLRGFPRAAGDAVAATLAARLPGFEVTRPDPDTLAAVGRAVAMDAAPPPGLGVPRLAGPPFDGLYAEVRFTATARKRSGKSVAAGTLVLAGELGPDGFTLYTVWAEGASDVANLQALSTPWADEEAWRDDLDEFRGGKRVEAGANALADRSFPKLNATWLVMAWAWLAVFPFTGERRRVRFLRKLAANLALVSFVAVLAWLVPSSGFVDRMLNVILLTLLAMPLGLLLYQFFFGLLLIRRLASVQYAIVYNLTGRLVPADAAVISQFFDNPFGRKDIADWHAAGTRRFADTVLDEPTLDHGGVRLSHAPDGSTVVLMASSTAVPGPGGTTQNRIWPANVFIQLLTRFPDESVVATTNDLWRGFRRKLTGPSSVGRVHLGVTAPADLLAAHAESCRQHAERTGLSPVPALTFDAFAGWHADRAAQDKRLYAANPVTWSDAFVLLMGYVRRAYR